MAERKIVTCAHVVNVALGLEIREQRAPAGEVSVDFPLVSIKAGQQIRRAKVEKWLPPSREGAAGDDIAGLTLLDDPPDGVEVVGLGADLPHIGRRVRIFGYPSHRPDGGWVEATIRGRVGNGRIQLDSDSALRVERGFSGGPVYDEAIGRIVGLIATAPANALERDSYAIGADRLRLAWPEVLSGRWQRTFASRRVNHGEITILHVSDMRFGSQDEEPFARIQRDILDLAAGPGLRPDVLIATGDLTAAGLPSQFRSAFDFLGQLSEAAEIPRRHVAIVPGSHDVNRKACRAYFDEQESKEAVPTPPYFPKWNEYVAAFAEFYTDIDDVAFTPDEPWTLFAMPELNVVVAGLNSTMAETHREDDRYGQVGERQLQWFAEWLEVYRIGGWLRLAAVHHGIRSATPTGLRDASEVGRVLAQPRLANLILHGQADDTNSCWFDFGTPALASRYQLITVRREEFTRYGRQFATAQGRWVGDTRISTTGSDWLDRRPCALTDIDAVFPSQVTTGRDGQVSADRPGSLGEHEAAAEAEPGSGRGWRADPGPGSPYDEFLDR